MRKKNYWILPVVILFLYSCSDKNNSQGPDVPEPQPPAVEMKTIKYAPTDEIFVNPERGFYTEIESNATNPVDDGYIQRLHNEGKTLVQILYYFKDYRDKDLPSGIVSKLNTDMGIIRKNGMKAILRFAYTSAQTEPDASMNVIKRHLDQMKPVFTVNKDVIACVQAGFIGAWGEWYYSSNHLNNTASYKELLNKWLEVLPKDRCIQVRTPKYKQDFIGSSTAITAKQAFSNEPIARIAHHNDAFMSDKTNMGTYIDVEKDKTYLAEEGLYLPIGGETCLPNSSATPSAGKDAVDEMRLLHWSFLNDAYDRNVLKKWETDGYLPDIKKNLGYRIVLSRGEYSIKHIPGSDLVIKLELQNVGYASMYNPRNVKLILRSTKDKTEYEVTLPDDPRTWKPLHNASVNRTIALPTNIPAGSYQFFLFMPDPEKSIASRPEYAVRLANDKIWESATGYNNLGINIEISATGNLKKSSSSIRFIKK